MASQSFKGAIIDSSHDYSQESQDCTGSYISLVPQDESDVLAAVQLAQATKRKLVLRSGTEHLPGNYEDCNDAIVLNLKNLSFVTFEDGVVTIGPAVTVGQLSNELKARGFFLPLSDNSHKTVLSELRADELGYFSRSFGKLSNFVSQLDLITNDGEEIKTPVTSNASSAIVAAKGIITAITLKYIPAQGINAVRISAPFSAELFTKLTPKIISLSQQEIYHNVDFAVATSIGHYNTTSIILTIISASKELIDKAVAEIGVFEQLETIVIRADLTDNAIIESLLHENKTRYSLNSGTGYSYKQTFPGDILLQSSFLQIVDKAIGNISASFPELLLSSVIHSAVGHAVEVKVTFCTSLHETELEQYLRQAIEQLVGQKTEQQDVQTEPKVTEFAPPKAKVSSPKLLAMARAIQKPIRSEIPLFKGEIYTQDDPNYNKKRHQYASSSYPDNAMKPFLVSYPTDHRDIAQMLQYALAKGKKVVTRSGGHQYCGLSSGGNDTIVLSMDAFKRFDVYGNIAVVGVGNVLTDLANRFKDHHITIPHGECPLVGIGGHVQTGGYGHLLRSFGLALDYCRAFDIVLADGNLRSVYRPNPNQPNKENDELYWGVMGGGPGCFGVLTELEFDCIRDEDHPNSGGFSTFYLYNQGAFHAAMKSVQYWTQQVANQTNFPTDVDLCISAISSDGLRPAVVLLEMVYSNKDGGSDTSHKQVILDVVKNVNKNAGIFNAFNLLKKYEKNPLSYWSNSFVRRQLVDGREFSYPYDKRLNCTVHGLSDDFVEEFVALVTQTVEHSSLKLVVQMFIGGGSYKNPANPDITSISHRDAVHGLVFDIFYPPGMESAAAAQQKLMENLLGKYQQSSQEIRMFWGTFGDVNFENVKDLYYDSKEKIQRLQELKKRVDPTDLFHTSLSMPPAN